jgi:hypothetical protein
MGPPYVYLTTDVVRELVNHAHAVTTTPINVVTVAAGKSRRITNQLLYQLSYAGIPYTKAVFSGLIKRSSRPIFAQRSAKGDQNFTVPFYGIRNDFGAPRENRGRLLQDPAALYEDTAYLHAHRTRPCSGVTALASTDQ